MSTQERLALKGRLIEKKQKRKEFEISIRGLIRDMKSNLDPYEAIEDLNTDYCVQQALALRTAQAAYKVIQLEIHQLEKDLGED
jgi:hypothetical protein